MKMLSLAIISGLIFVISLIVHIMTFLPQSIISMDNTWWIHVAMFIPWIAVFVRLIILQARNSWYKRKDNKPFWEAYGDQYVASFIALKKLANMVPRIVLIISIALLAYIPINFAWCIYKINYSPAEDNGRYYLNSHGVYTQEQTHEEYYQYQDYEVRLFSGHWMFFSFFPFVYFMFIDKKIDKKEPFA